MFAHGNKMSNFKQHWLLPCDFNENWNALFAYHIRYTQWRF